MAVFLLGGCDLEMCLIKKLLKRYNQKFYDKNLKWGAKLSDYKDILQKHKNEKIYAIELQADIDVKNVEIIDHHNEYSNMPSSLEQVAEILNHKLSPFQKAVALNDKGYIYEMKKNCISEKNIKIIRKYDRKCQGVDEEVEKAAQQIELNSRIIYFPFDSFSALTDRIYFEKRWREYIIFNDKQTMFYGFNINDLKKLLKEKNIEIAFYGGGERGFLGVNKKIDKTILEEIFMKSIVSTHIFMFPFVIEPNVIEPKKFIQDLIENYGWEEKKFKIDKVEYFNEFVYFYEYVRDVLYGLDGEKGLARYIEKNLKENSINKFVIRLKNLKEYRLEIEDISLRIFNNSIGVLSFHLNNYDYANPDDILKINEYGRRIYPQFLDNKEYVNKTKDVFLADEIELILDGKTVAKEDFSKFSKNFLDLIKNFDTSSLKRELNKILLPSYITSLIGDKIKPILDDRMFVVSCFIDKDEEILCKLKKFENNEYGYIKDEWWYKYVFVDGSYKTCQSKVFCPEIIKKSTYDRWVDEGTLWGISRYSFVGISNWDLMLIHTKTIYYQMMVLLLMYRAMIVHFSNKVQDIVDDLKRDSIEEKLQEKSKNLYTEYLKFLNGLYFKEVTPQEQGIELYKKALEIMEIESYIKDFDREMQELDNLIEMEVEKERNKDLEKLNKIATLFLPPTLIAGIAGMNVGVFDVDKKTKFLIIFALMFFSVVISKMIIEKKEFADVLREFKEFCKDNKIIGCLIIMMLFIIFLLGVLG